MRGWWQGGGEGGGGRKLRWFTPGGLNFLHQSERVEVEIAGALEAGRHGLELSSVAHTLPAAT